MNRCLCITGGLLGAIAAFMIWGPHRRKPVRELAKTLEVAWADHHTIA